jgi:hypothetical protein
MVTWLASRYRVCNMKNRDFLRCAIFGSRPRPGLPKFLPVIAALVLCSAFPAPASAGFYETLFGMSRSGAHGFNDFGAPAPYYERREHRSHWRTEARHVRRHFTRHQVIAVAAPSAPSNAAALAPASGVQAINSILTDPTLRPGDAYVGTDGVRIFVGSRYRAPEAKDFVPVPPKILAAAKFQARLAPYRSKAPAKQLAAIEVKAVPTPAPSSPLALQPVAAQARTSSLAKHSPPVAPLPPRPAASEQVITDASGKKIRLVGAFVPH